MVAFCMGRQSNIHYHARNVLGKNISSNKMQLTCCHSELTLDFSIATSNEVGC